MLNETQFHDLLNLEQSMRILIGQNHSDERIVTGQKANYHTHILYLSIPNMCRMDAENHAFIVYISGIYTYSIYILYT